MIPINLAGFTLMLFLIPLSLIVLWNTVFGVHYFYQKSRKGKETEKSSRLLELKYLLSIVSSTAASLFYMYDSLDGYYTSKSMKLNEETAIDGIVFPAQSNGVFSNDEKGMRFKEVSFPHAFNFQNIQIVRIKRNYKENYHIKLAYPQRIEGILCDTDKKIEVNKQGKLISCNLDKGNVWSGVSIPEKMKLEYSEATDTWKIRSFEKEKIHGVNYTMGSVRFELDKALNLLSFEGEVEETRYDDGKIREMMHQENVGLRSESK